VIREAKFCETKKNRYFLKRQWDRSKGLLLYIMLNPSMADDTNDDPTIRRLINFTKKFNYGGFLVGNIFTKITPNPKEVDKSRGITNKNFEELLKLINKVDQIVYAWGNSVEEPKILKELISNPKCFGKNFNGTPKHPLYLPSSSKLESYRD
jgi:hypothetical protein|tara:strand:- start:143 stop:598 length:456 start_codon:yes stop_codon:yes gene_type:complete